MGWRARAWGLGRCWRGGENVEGVRTCNGFGEGHRDELGRLRYGTGFAEAWGWRSLVYKLGWR